MTSSSIVLLLKRTTMAINSIVKHNATASTPSRAAHARYNIKQTPNQSPLNLGTITFFKRGKVCCCFTCDTNVLHTCKHSCFTHASRVRILEHPKYNSVELSTKIPMYNSVEASAIRIIIVTLH